VIEPPNKVAARDAGDVSGASILGEGAKDCTESSSVSELRLVPEAPTLFRYVGSPCKSLDSVVSAQNIGSSSITITGISISDGFTLGSSDQFPVRVLGDAAVDISIGFRGIKEEVCGELTIATSRGCGRYSVRGRSVEEGGLITFDHLALNFGELQAGESRVRSIALLVQGTGQSSTISGVQVSPAGALKCCRTLRIPSWHLVSPFHCAFA
jgi:hypothetical protein